MPLFITRPTYVRPAIIAYDDIYIAPTIRTYTVPRYENLNYNSDMRRKISEYFHKKTIQIGRASV